MKLLNFLKLATCSLSVNMLKLTNLYRKYYNMEELKPIPPLQMASDLQANHMCKEMKVTHEGPPGREMLRDRLESFNFSGVTMGENVAKQENDDYKEVFKVWIKSKQHRKNILGDYTYSAVTTCRGQDDKRYWVQVFGKDLSNNNIREMRQNATDTLKENRLLDYFIKGRSKGPVESTASKEVENTPISIENTLSISRRFSQPQTITKTETVTQSSIAPEPQDYDEKESMELLFKEGEDIKNVLKKLPSDFQMAFKGNYKKYIAFKKPDTKSNEETKSDLKSELLGKKDGPKKDLSGSSSLKKSTYVPTSSKSSSSTVSSSSTSVDTNSKNYEELLKTILDKMKKSESKPNPETSTSSSSSSSTTSFTSNLTSTATVPKTTSVSLSISSIISSIPPKTVTLSLKPNTTTELIYKTVFVDKSQSKDSSKPTIKTETSTVTQPVDTVTNNIGNINILTITKKSSLSLSPVYKTTKIGSISVLNNNSEFRTITVTVLKDSVDKPVNKEDKDVTNTVGVNDSKDKNFMEVMKEAVGSFDQQNNPKSSSLVENKDGESLLEFNSNLKRLFKDLLNTGRRKSKLFRSSSIDRDNESRLKEYVDTLICDKEVNPSVTDEQCEIIDIGEPIVD